MSNTSLTFPATLGDKLARLPRLLWQSFLVQWPFHLIAIGYALTTWWMLRDVPQYKQAPIEGLALGIITFTFPIGIVAVFLFRFGQYAFVLKPDSPVKQMGRDIASLITRPAALLTAIPMMFAMILFNKGMLELKPMIPLIKPFAYDQALVQWDRALHFGFDPWVLLHPIFGNDIATLALSIAYNMWFLAMFGTFMWFGFARHISVLRTQFFFAYMMSWWIGGGILATLFSSAGPVYYGNIGLSPNPYEPLFAFLNDVNTRLPIWTLDTQNMLWNGYLGKADPIGISAFPSMHNAMALLFALVTWKLNRKMGIAFAVFAGLILVGSVHLGWHYAVDGYGAYAITLLFWWLGGIVARWHASLASTQKLNEGLASL
jgi:PAP2 superfamily